MKKINKLKKLVNMIGNPVNYDKLINIMTSDEKIIKYTQDNNLIIAYWIDDGTCYFEGAKEDDLYMPRQNTPRLLVADDLEFDNQYASYGEFTDCYDCYYYKEYWRNKKYATLTGVYDGSYNLNIDIPHETFKIIDITEKDKYEGQGIVFCLDDITHKKIKMSNADWIRNMSDKDLALLLNDISCIGDWGGSATDYFEDCKEDLKEKNLNFEEELLYCLQKEVYR